MPKTRFQPPPNSKTRYKKRARQQMVEAMIAQVSSRKPPSPTITIPKYMIPCWEVFQRKLTFLSSSYKYWLLLNCSNSLLQPFLAPFDVYIFEVNHECHFGVVGVALVYSILRKTLIRYYGEKVYVKMLVIIVTLLSLRACP